MQFLPGRWGWPSSAPGLGNRGLGDSKNVNSFGWYLLTPSLRCLEMVGCRCRKMEISALLYILKPSLFIALEKGRFFTACSALRFLDNFMVQSLFLY